VYPPSYAFRAATTHMRSHRDRRAPRATSCRASCIAIATCAVFTACSRCFQRSARRGVSCRPLVASCRSCGQCQARCARAPGSATGATRCLRRWKGRLDMGLGRCSPRRCGRACPSSLQQGAPDPDVLRRAGRLRQASAQLVGRPQRCAERYHSVPKGRVRTETLVSVRKIAGSPEGQSARSDAMQYFSLSLYIEDARPMRPRHMQRLLEHSVTDDLERLIAEMAREKAHHHHCSLAEATRQIRTRVVEAREEYRAAGAPYGDDDHGFCRWLLVRPRLTPSA
jgi:hypothetical protein